MGQQPVEGTTTWPESAWVPPDAELELYEDLRRRDETAFRCLAANLQPILTRLARLSAGSGADAEAAVVRTWELALGGLDMFRWQTPFATWVAGITVSLGRSRTRQGAARRAPPPTPDHPRTPGTAPGPSDWADLPWGARWEGAWQVLRDSVETLPLPEREVIHCRDVERWPIRRVCDVLGLPEVAYERLLDRGRRQLHDRLALLVGAGDGDHHLTAQLVAVADMLHGLLDPAEEPLDPRTIRVFRRWRRPRRRLAQLIPVRSGHMRPHRTGASLLVYGRS